MKRLIHVVDDDDVVELIFIRAMKAYEDIEMIHYLTGRDAIAAFETKKPIMTFLDYHLPDMNGSELMSKYLAEDPDQKIIIITDSEDPELKDLLIREGATGFISKNYDDFREALDQYL